MGLPMLAAALWMVQNPDWWIEILQALQDSLYRWQSQWGRQAVLPQRLRNDRRTRMGVRLMGGLVAVLAAMHLYQDAVWMLAHYGR
jgi:hypothetical protein